MSRSQRHLAASLQANAARITSHNTTSHDTERPRPVAGALKGWQRQQVLGVEALPGGWEVPRNISKALADEMVVRAVTLTGAPGC